MPKYRNATQMAAALKKEGPESGLTKWQHIENMIPKDQYQMWLNSLAESTVDVVGIQGVLEEDDQLDPEVRAALYALILNIATISLDVGFGAGMMAERHEVSDLEGETFRI